MGEWPTSPQCGGWLPRDEVLGWIDGRAVSAWGWADEPGGWLAPTLAESVGRWLVRSSIVERHEVDDDTIRAWTAEERRRTAKDLRIVADAAWELPSLCDGWRCRDVLGHLVWLAESTRPKVFRDVALTFRPPNPAIRRIGRRHGDVEVNELLDRLEAAAEGNFYLPGAGPQAALAEVLTHRADITRVTEGPTRSSDERTHVVVTTYRDYWWFYGVSRQVRSAHLVADDAGFSVGPNDGPEVRGPGLALMLALAGRRGARADLHGATEVFG